MPARLHDSVQVIGREVSVSGKRVGTALSKVDAYAFAQALSDEIVMHEAMNQLAKSITNEKDKSNGRKL